VWGHTGPAGVSDKTHHADDACYNDSRHPARPSHRTPFRLPDHAATFGLERTSCCFGCNPLAPTLYYTYNVLLIMLGEFEYLVLTISARLGDEAYGAAIRRDLEQATGHRCSLGALYTTLDRLESKGLISTVMGNPTPARGGRAKRMVRVTAKGVRGATAFYNAILQASRGVSWEARIATAP